MESRQRKFTRIPLEMRIRVTFSGVEARRQALTENLSEGGLFIRADQLRPVGTKLLFEFSVRDGAAPIQGAGVIRWVEERAGKTKGMGIQFVELNDEGRRELTAIIRARKQ